MNTEQTRESIFTVNNLSNMSKICKGFFKLMIGNRLIGVVSKKDLVYWYSNNREMERTTWSRSLLVCSI